MIHPKAHVEGATIGARTKVWQFASVIRGAVVGADCVVASGACIDGSRVGDRCIIGHNVAMGPGFWVGDDVFIGPNVTLCNDAWPRTHKQGFDPAAFDDGRYCIVIENGASICAGAVIMPGVRIGEGAMVGAGQVCGRDVPAHHMMINQQVCVPIGTQEKVRMRFAGEFVRPPIFGAAS